ncbi:MAG: hypothetical protein Q8M02_07495 [Candidatus Didemnitutus sp.]|nr:hypothetical protein [Candidatus Didemnitutus sp.]
MSGNASAVTEMNFQIINQREVTRVKFQSQPGRSTAQPTARRFHPTSDHDDKQRYDHEPEHGPEPPARPFIHPFA